MLRRQVDRPRFSWSDRALIALLASLVPRERWRSFLVTPQTVLDWHRRLVRRRWTYPHRRPGRPRLADETVELICRLARENPRWGYLRIVGELKKLGVAVSKTSVAAVLRKNRVPPAPRRAGIEPSFQASPGAGHGATAHGPYPRRLCPLSARIYVVESQRYATGPLTAHCSTHRPYWWRRPPSVLPAGRTRNGATIIRLGRGTSGCSCHVQVPRLPQFDASDSL